MRDRLADLLEKADLAIGSCSGVVEPSTLDPLIESIRRIRIRLAYPGRVLVVALAGGTGSGKSSLFNALVGEEVVDVGGMRPTTRRPTAAVARDAARSLDVYLDRLAIETRHVADIDDVCLIDLPDTDSVELDHRHRVDSVLPLVDVVVWVTDPEKYHDARLHLDYLRPLAAYAGQFVFVLNQIDRITTDQARLLVADLARALAEDGILDAVIVPVAADPRSGPPLGIDDVERALDGKRRDGAALYGKLITDLEVTSAALEEATGSSVDFDARLAPILDRAVELVIGDEIDAAASELTGLLDELARELSGPAGEKVERFAADVPLHLERIAVQAMPPTPRLWFGRLGSKPGRDPGQVRGMIREAVVLPVRAVLAKRALAQASVADLVMGVQSLR